MHGFSTNQIPDILAHVAALALERNVGLAE